MEEILVEEKPREYKKRVDEEWIRNGENVNKLIKEIDEYELLDKNYKTLTKQQILENFSKNQKAEKESEKYLRVVLELEKADEKYKELEELKENLKTKEIEKEKMEREIVEIKWDGVDQTTLDLQMAALNEKNAKYETLVLEIDELEKDIANREQEIQEMESTYWVKDINNEPVEEDSNIDEKLSTDSVVRIPSTDGVVRTPSTLKEHYEQTIKDLWNKDKTLKEIYKLLDDWIWIDDKLKKKIKDDVSDKFLEYYDKNQWTLRMKSARFMKNRVGNSVKRVKEVRNSRKWSEREFKLQEIEREENIYWWEIWKVREFLNLSEKLNTELVEIKRCWEIAWRPVIKVKDKRWYYSIIWGRTQCGGGFFEEIWEIQNIWNKPCFKVKDKRWFYSIIWGNTQWLDDFKEVWEIQDIWKKPCFKVKDGDWEWWVYWWIDRVGGWYKEIWEIKDIWKKPCFKAKDRDWDWWVRWWTDSITWYEEIWEIQNIWNKPCFIKKNVGWYLWVQWWVEQCGGWYKEIWEIKDIWKKPCFKVKKEDWEYLTWGSYRSASWYKEIWEVFDAWSWMPAFMAQGKDGHWQTYMWQ